METPLCFATTEYALNASRRHPGADFKGEVLRVLALAPGEEPVDVVSVIYVAQISLNVEREGHMDEESS